MVMFNRSDIDHMVKVLRNSAIVPALLEMRRDITTWDLGTVALQEIGMFKPGDTKREGPPADDSIGGTSNPTVS